MPDLTLKHKKFQVPKKCVQVIKRNFDSFDGPKTTEGYNRAKNIIDNPTISFQLLKKINNFFRNVEKDSWPYKLTGGDYGMKVFKRMEDEARRKESSSRKNKMRGQMMNTHKKPHEKSGIDLTKTDPVPKITKNELIEQIGRINKLIKDL